MGHRTASSSNIVTKNQPSPENDYDFPPNATKSTSDPPPPVGSAPASKPSSATSLASLLGVAKKVVKSQSPSQLSVPSRTTFSNTKWSRVVKNPLEAATDGNEVAGGVLGVSSISGVTTMANSSGNDADNNSATTTPSEVASHVQNNVSTRSRTSAAVGPTLDEAAGVARRERDRLAAGAEDGPLVVEQPIVSVFRAPGKRLGDVMDDKTFVINPQQTSVEKSQGGSTGLFGSAGSYGGIAAALLKAPNTWAPFPKKELKELKMEQGGSLLQNSESEEANKTAPFKPSSPTSMPSQVAIAIGRFSSSSTAARTTLLQDPSPTVPSTAHSKSVVNSRSSAFINPSCSPSPSSTGRIPSLNSNTRAAAAGSGTTFTAAPPVNPPNLLYSLSEIGPDANTNWRTRGSRDRSPDDHRGQTAGQFQSVRSSKRDKSPAVRKKHLQSDDSRTADLCSADLRSTDLKSADFSEGLNLPAPPFSPPPFSNFARTPPSCQKDPSGALEPSSEDCRRENNPMDSDGRASVVYLMRHSSKNSAVHPHPAQSQVLLVDSDHKGMDNSPELFHCNNQNGSSTPPDQTDAISSSSSNIFSRRYLDSAGCGQPYQHYHHTPTPSFTQFMLASAGNRNMNPLQCNRTALNSSSSNFRTNWEGLMENSDNDDFATLPGGQNMLPDHRHPDNDRAQECLDRRMQFPPERPDLLHPNRLYLRHPCGAANPALHDDSVPHQRPFPKNKSDEHTRVFNPATTTFGASFVANDNQVRSGGGKDAPWDSNGYLNDEEPTFPPNSARRIAENIRGRSTDDRLNHMAPLMVPVCRVHPGLARAIARQHVNWPETNSKPATDDFSSMSPMHYPNQSDLSHLASTSYVQGRDRQRGDWGHEEGNKNLAPESMQYRFQSKLPPASPLERPLNGTASNSISSSSYASAYMLHSQYRDSTSFHQLNATEGASSPVGSHVVEQFRQRHLLFDNFGDVSRHSSGGLPSTVKTGVSTSNCASDVNCGMHAQIKIPITEGRSHLVSSDPLSSVNFNDSSNSWPLPVLYADKMAQSISPFHPDLWISSKDEFILREQLDENRKEHDRSYRRRHEDFEEPGQQKAPTVANRADSKNRRRKEKRAGTENAKWSEKVLQQVETASDPLLATETVKTNNDRLLRRSSSNEDHSDPVAQADNDGSSVDARKNSRQPTIGGQRRIASTGSSIVDEKRNKLVPPLRLTRNGKNRNSPSKRNVANPNQTSNGTRGLVSTAAAIAQLHRTGGYRQQQESRGNPCASESVVDITGSSKLSKLSTTTEAGSCASNFHSNRRGNNGNSSLGGGSGSRQRGNPNNRSVVTGPRSAARGATKGPKSKVA